MASTVYSSGVSKLLPNLLKHLASSGFSPGKQDAVAIKLHMGEEGNVRYIRPAIVRAVADWVKSQGAEPFVTDSTTLYRRRRGTLFDYLRTAARHGFSAETMGCPVLIADGLKSRGIKVRVRNPLKLDEVGVAPLIHEADALIGLSHVTMHPDILPAASIKNVAMGCTDKEAKMRMHASRAKPRFDAARCTGCGICVRHCPTGAIELEEAKARFDLDRCVSCAECIAFCEHGAVRVSWSALSEDVARGAVDAAQAVLSTFEPGKSVFLNLGYDVTEECDCAAGSEYPVITDFGLLSSLDPVAVDAAAADMLNRHPTYPGGSMQKLSSADDRLAAVRPKIDWRGFLALAESAGLGSRSYELVHI